MPTGMELLQRTVEKLKDVEFKHWRYEQDGNLSSYSYFPPSMRVTVCRREDELSRCYFMRIKDIAENKEVAYSYVESLYNHLETQRAKNETVPTNEKKPLNTLLNNNLLLERLLETLE